MGVTRCNGQLWRSIAADRVSALHLPHLSVPGSQVLTHLPLYREHVNWQTFHRGTCQLAARS